MLPMLELVDVLNTRFIYLSHCTSCLRFSYGDSSESSRLRVFLLIQTHDSSDSDLLELKVPVVLWGDRLHSVYVM